MAAVQSTPQAAVLSSQSRVATGAVCLQQTNKFAPAYPPFCHSPPAAGLDPTRGARAACARRSPCGARRSFICRESQPASSARTTQLPVFPSMRDCAAAVSVTVMYCSMSSRGVMTSGRPSESALCSGSMQAVCTRSSYHVGSSIYHTPRPSKQRRGETPPSKKCGFGSLWRGALSRLFSGGSKNVCRHLVFERVWETLPLWPCFSVTVRPD